MDRQRLIYVRTECEHARLLIEMMIRNTNIEGKELDATLNFYKETYRALVEVDADVREEFERAVERQTVALETIAETLAKLAR